jgi:hypothetical protein
VIDEINNRFDPDKLRIDTGEVCAVTPKKIKRRRRQFTMMPGIWQERLVGARYIASYRAALHILKRHWENSGEPFTLSNGAMELEGVGRGAKWRALLELEQLELITIERRKRKSPRVTALHTTGGSGGMSMGRDDG